MTLKQKNIWTDPSFWILTGINGYLVYHYYQHPEIFTTLISLYWCQSLLLGIFTILDLLTVKNTTAITYKMDNVLTSIADDKKSRIGSTKFFIWTYGLLHFLYFLFLLAMRKGAPPIQWSFFKYFLLAFLAGQVLNFIQHKVQQRKQATNTGPMIFTPFIRILPMHLTIVLAANFPVHGLGIFLILKSLADMVMYIATKPAYKSREADAAMLATQQGM